MATTNGMVSTQSNLAKMKAITNGDGYLAKVKDLLGKEAQTFTTSMLDLYTTDGYLSKCNPSDVITEALKAAALKLPIAKSLGFAYVIPYGGKPQFQLGYRGLIQLAQRSGQYRYINADAVYEGESVKYDRVTGMLEIAGEATSETPVGYFAYFELLNGYRKSVYWSKQKVEAHARKYSKAWSKQDSPWHTQFDAMALKTVLKNILSKYGILSIELASTLQTADPDEKVEAEVNENANASEVMIPTEFADDEAEQTKEIHAKAEEPKQITLDVADKAKEEPEF